MPWCTPTMVVSGHENLLEPIRVAVERTFRVWEDCERMGWKYFVRHGTPCTFAGRVAAWLEMVALVVTHNTIDMWIPASYRSGGMLIIVACQFVAPRFA